MTCFILIIPELPVADSVRLRIRSLVIKADVLHANYPCGFEPYSRILLPAFELL